MLHSLAFLCLFVVLTPVRRTPGTLLASHECAGTCTYWNRRTTKQMVNVVMPQQSHSWEVVEEAWFPNHYGLSTIITWSIKVFSPLELGIFVEIEKSNCLKCYLTFKKKMISLQYIGTTETVLLVSSSLHCKKKFPCFKIDLPSI